MTARVVESESGVGGVACFQLKSESFFFKLLESESGFQKCWSRFFKTVGVGSRFFKTAGVGVRSRNPNKSSYSTTLVEGFYILTTAITKKYYIFLFTQVH